MVNIEPIEYQHSTAFKERMEIVDKVNEIVDVVNNSGGGTPSDTTYGIIPTTILNPVDTGVRVMGSGHGIISGVLGMSVNGVGRYIPITYYASPLMPDRMVCDVIQNGNELQFIRATISGTVTNHVINFTLVGNGTETPLTVNMARMSMLKKV